MITTTSTEAEVLEYLRSKSESLVTRLGVSTFGGIDGEVFLGLTPATVDMLLPGLELREKGLLLARIETCRQQAGFVDAKNIPSVFQIHTEIASPLPVAPVSPVAPPRDVTPPPLALANRFPRLLVELWREREFIGETWLPDVTECMFGTQTFRLGLRRGMRRRNDAAGVVMASRKWFGALVVSGRFYQTDAKLELMLIEVKDVVRGGDGEFFLNIFVTADNGMKLVFSSQSRAAGESGDSYTVVGFNESVVLKFGREGVSAGTVTVHEPGDVVRSEPVVDRGRAPSLPPVPIDVSIERFKTCMWGNAKKSDSGDASAVSLPTLLGYAHGDTLFQLDPRYHRFEAYLLPTHEVSAQFGAEYILRSATQIELLKSDADYMRSHGQVVELLLAAWGFGDDLHGVWNGHSWLLRHALLSCVLLGSKECAKRLVRAAKELGPARQVDVSETGFGEALFTLMGDKEKAEKFWNQPVQVALLRNGAVPNQRTPLGQMMLLVDRM